MIIYKYIDSCWGEKILDDQRIKISDPQDFNDPFEFLPRMRNDITDKEIEAKLKDPPFLKNYYQHCLKKGHVDSPKSFKKWLKKHNIRKEMAAYYRGNNYKSNDFRELAAQCFGVTCFSSKRDNLLMWAHYADNHKGLVIGIERDCFASLIYEVAYEQERVVYSPAMTGESRMDATKKVLWTKSPDWSYEEELRAIIPWKLCTKKSDRYFYAIEPSAIKEVIFGIRINPTLRQSIIDKKTGNFSHLKLFDSIPSDDSFSIEFNEVAQRTEPMD